MLLDGILLKIVFTNIFVSNGLYFEIYEDAFYKLSSILFYVHEKSPCHGTSELHCHWGGGHPPIQQIDPQMRNALVYPVNWIFLLISYANM